MAQREIPKVHIPVNHVPAKTGEIIKLGAITCRVMEDGSRTGAYLLCPKPFIIRYIEIRPYLLIIRLAVIHQTIALA
jgi:hypothetical protein